MQVHNTLLQAFELRADGVSADLGPLIGYFGEGVPLPLVETFGGLAVDVKAPPLSDETDSPMSVLVSTVTEPFLDPFATRFLHRFAAGAFDRFATIIFARDDLAGLAAYQYALELRRQSLLATQGPELFLWNLLHTDSVPAEQFNKQEATRLITHLQQTLGSTLDPARLSEAIAAETTRAKAIATLPAGGTDAFIARNAGRWMTAKAHTALLSPLKEPEGASIVLVGTACDIPVMHDLCADFGQVRADLQDYGRRSPQPLEAADFLHAIVHDPLSPRAAPPLRYTTALREGLAGADLVIASMDTNDDAFGWELPGLRDAAIAQGAQFLNLGFRPFRPDDEWKDTARKRIAEALT